MKKRLCLVLSLLMLTICISTLAESAEWNYDAEYCILRGYTGAGGDVAVPGEINGGTVDVIDINVFTGETITALSLPETVLELRSNAVTWCPNLVSVSLPQSLVVINRLNFGNCGALAEVTIPAGVRYIGDSSFTFCESLRKITFEGVCPVIDQDCFTVLPEDAVAYVPDDQLDAYAEAFASAGSAVSVQPSGKSAVVVDNNGYVESEFDFDASTGTITRYNGYATYLAIPETIGGAAVKAIGPEAFAHHYYLALLELPEGLEAIGDGAFYNCATLGHVKFPSTLKTIGDNAFYNAYQGSLFELPSAETIGDFAFYFAGIKGSVALPDGLTSIGKGAFESCGSLGGTLYLPASLETIGDGAFKGNLLLQYVIVDSPTPPTLGEGVFAGCDYLYDIDLYAHGTKQQMLDWQAYVDALGIPCRVWRAQDPTAESPESGAYQYENLMLTEYTGAQPRIHAHLTVSQEPVVGLGDGVFKGSQTIEYFSVAHNDAFTTIGAEAFMDSTLREVDLFDSVTTIGARAFAGCAQLETLTLPESVTEIGEGALDGLTGLKKLVVKCDPAILPASAFANLSNLTDVTIETGAIPANLFAGSGVTTLALGEGVTEIGESAFANTALTAVDLKNAATIGANAFEGTALTSAELTSATSIGNGAFEGTPLQTVTLNAAASVGERAFANTQLAQLILPTSGSFHLSAIEGTGAELRLPADASDEQIAAWNGTLGRPWYDPILREGEANKFVKMPFETTPAENFDFDPETGLILAYTGTDVDVVVPREIDGVTVVGFKDYNAFASCQDYTNTETETNQTDWVHLRTLVLPETITTLPDAMLSYCQQLETFVCYAPLESTGKNQFMLCRSLNNVIFVNGVRMIDNYAFDSAGPLGNLYFGEHLDVIRSQAFNFAELSSLVVDAGSVEYGAFTECQNLTNLHFTGKVASFGENCIINCTNLAEICFDGCDLTASPAGLMMNVAPSVTVHVPEGTSEANLERAQNCQSWSETPSEITVTTEPCAHALPALPDVDALLAGLEKGESAEPAESVSAAESETTALDPALVSYDIPEEYLGVWYGVSIEEYGEVYPLTDLGFDITVAINADGTAEMNMGGEVDVANCAMYDGALMVETMTGTAENGLLVLAEAGYVMTFSREKPDGAAAVPDTDGETQPADISDEYLGVWYGLSMEMEGDVLQFAELGMEVTITIHAGGTAEMNMDGEVDIAPCAMVDGALMVDTMTGTIENGELLLNDEGVLLRLNREQPEAAAPALDPEPEPAATGAGIISEIKFVLTDANVQGSNMTAAMLGGYEYSVLLHEDGTVKFVMAGADIPGLTWVYGKVPTDAGELDGVILDYYGQALYLVPTEKGFDMDYFGSMLMHFEPEDSAQ